MMVAPLAGAWVEMSNSVLKKPEYIVAPLAGAWVEIAIQSCTPKFNSVAPLAGAWVAIISRGDNFVHGYRRSPRGSVG